MTILVELLHTLMMERQYTYLMEHQLLISTETRFMILEDNILAFLAMGGYGIFEVSVFFLLKTQ